MSGKAFLTVVVVTCKYAFDVSHALCIAGFCDGTHRGGKYGHGCTYNVRNGADCGGLRTAHFVVAYSVVPARLFSACISDGDTRAVASSDGVTLSHASRYV